MTDLAELASVARQFETLPMATSTERAYRADWRLFREWCETHGLPWDPPDAESVRLYLAQGVVDGRSIATLERRLSGISHGLTTRGHNGRAIAWNQGVRSVLRGVKRDSRSKGEVQKRATPLLMNDIVALTEPPALTDGDLRDHAILWIQFLTGMRPSEVASLNVEDITAVPEGLEIALRRSKTDQEARGVKLGAPRGSETACPVAAWTAWLAAYGETQGPAFATVSKHGTVRRGRGSPRRISARAITEMIQRRTAEAGLTGSFSGNSPRRGYTTQAKAVGVSDDAIKQHARWIRDKTMQKYVDQTDPWTANPATHFRTAAS